MDVSATSTIHIKRITVKEADYAQDILAVEEPLEIRIIFGEEGNRVEKNISVTMRTPGSDAELASGFLFTEGIIKNATDIHTIKHTDPDGNRILLELSDRVQPSIQKLERNFYTTSSCGVCGKSSIDAIRVVCENKLEKDHFQVDATTIIKLPDLLREQQQVFESTGGLHASALFSLTGELLFLKEDVGRHNALDKLIGYALAINLLSLNKHILLLSGRASFELIQ